jgi:hypothetical protein
MFNGWTIYLFKEPQFAPAGNTVVCVARRELVAHIFGGGGLVDTAGLSAAFGGAVVYKTNEATVQYLGVWGARNASRFRSALRRGGAVLDIVRETVPGRLDFFLTGNRRPPPPDRSSTPSSTIA